MIMISQTPYYKLYYGKFLNKINVYLYQTDQDKYYGLRMIDFGSAHRKILINKNYCNIVVDSAHILEHLYLEKLEPKYPDHLLYGQTLLHITELFYTSDSIDIPWFYDSALDFFNVFKNVMDDIRTEYNIVNSFKHIFFNIQGLYYSNHVSHFLSSKANLKDITLSFCEMLYEIIYSTMISNYVFVGNYSPTYISEKIEQYYVMMRFDPKEYRLKLDQCNNQTQLILLDQQRKNFCISYMHFYKASEAAREYIVKCLLTRYLILIFREDIEIYSATFENFDYFMVKGNEFILEKIFNIFDEVVNGNLTINFEDLKLQTKNRFIEKMKKNMSNLAQLFLRFKQPICDVNDFTEVSLDQFVMDVSKLLTNYKLFIY